MAFVPFLNKTSKWLDNLVYWIVIILLALMVLVTSAGVFWRYALNDALSWSEELSRFLLVWISFLGASMAVYRHSHIGVSIVFDRLPPKAKPWLSRIVDILIIIFMGAILIGGIKILPFVKFRIAPTLALPMNIPYLIMPISASIIIYHILVRLITGFYTNKGGL